MSTADRSETEQWETKRFLRDGLGLSRSRPRRRYTRTHMIIAVVISATVTWAIMYFL